MNYQPILDFARSHISSAVEILILSVLLYYSYLYLRGTRGARILIGLALVFLTLTFLSQLFQLQVIEWLLRSFSVFLAIALVVIFQPELRRALTELGSHRWLGGSFEKKETVAQISDATFELASKGIGGLLAIEREIDLTPYAESGVAVDAELSKELVVTIFHPKTLLHDGGMIIRNGRVAAAGCIFPLTQREDIDRHLGLRHRAALGLTEESDAIAIVVSEENGQVSICHNGRIERNLNFDRFEKRLAQLLMIDDDDEKNTSEQLEGKTDLPDSGNRPVVSDKTGHHTKPTTA